MRLIINYPPGRVRSSCRYLYHTIFQICILKSKAIPCPRTGRFKCPVPKCTIDGRSRVGVAKHFRRDHKDYRSWRDVFIKKDAPDFILKPNENHNELDLEETPISEQNNTTHQTSGNSQLMKETNTAQNGLLMMATPTGNNISDQINTITEPIQQLSPPSMVSQNIQK